MDYSTLTPTEAIVQKQEEVRNSLKKKETALMRNEVLLTPERKIILGLSFQELRDSLKNGNLKALDVLQAFQAMALIQTKKTCCITEFIPDAEIWAKERDSLPESKRGLLHGMPISIKENFDIKGMDTTIGLTKGLGKPAKKHAILVEAILKQGAVPFVKTNVPQLIYSVGCSNPIFGCTSNPHDTSRSPGGSSGGEAALIVGGGSVLGIGSDMFGSVRIPASFCGTYSIKPTQRRISRDGSYGTFKSMIGVANASGFLGKDVNALVTGMESILSDDYMHKLDPLVSPVLWRRDLCESTKKLTVGWYVQDEFLPVTPGIKRALHIAKQALINRGHRVIDFSPPSLEEIFEFGLDILLSEGGGAMLKHWEGDEIVDESVKFNKRIISAPSWFKFAMQKYFALSSPKLSKMASYDAAYSSDLWKAVARQKTYTDTFFETWRAEGLDAMVGPGYPAPAPHPKYHGAMMPVCSYFGYSNLCDMPTGTLPVTVENEEDQDLLDTYPETDYVYKLIKLTSKGAIGMPLSVQVAALPWMEEVLLHTMKELQIGIKDIETKDE